MCHLNQQVLFFTFNDTHIKIISEQMGKIVTLFDVLLPETQNSKQNGTVYEHL